MDRLFEGEEAVRVAEVVQGDPFQAFHGDVQDAAFLEDIEEGHDIGVEQLACGPRLAEETGLTFGEFLGTGALRRPDRLERHGPPDLGVEGQVHDAHGALAQNLLDLVATDLDRWLCLSPRRVHLTTSRLLYSLTQGITSPVLLLYLTIAH